MCITYRQYFVYYPITIQKCIYNYTLIKKTPIKSVEYYNTELVFKYIFDIWKLIQSLFRRIQKTLYPPEIFWVPEYWMFRILARISILSFYEYTSRTRPYNWNIWDSILPYFLCVFSFAFYNFLIKLILVMKLSSDLFAVYTWSRKINLKNVHIKINIVYT